MIPAQDFESLNFSELDGSTLDKLLTGSRITGAEPIGYPVTDGAVFYLQGEQGNKSVLVMESVLVTECDTVVERYIIRVAAL